MAILGDPIPDVPDPVVSGAITTANPISGFPMQVFDIPQVINAAYQANTDFPRSILHNEPWSPSGFHLVRGVRNEVYFVVRDHTAYAVDTTGLTLNLVAADGSVYLRFPLVLQDATKGRYLLIMAPEDVAQLPLGIITWSISFVRDDATQVLLWLDRKSTYSSASVIEGPLPDRPVITITWDDFSPLTSPANPYYVVNRPQYYSSALTGAAQHPYSGGSQVFAYSMTGFSGVVRIDGSLHGPTDDTADSVDWFEITATEYAAYTGSDSILATGYYVWVRMVVTKLAGTVDSLTLYFPVNPSV